MNSADQQTLESLLAKGIRIPPQPKILIEVRDTIAQGDYTMASVSRIISQDPGLVAMLFKLAHSPAFSRGRKFDRLIDVLQIIGIQQTYNLVQSIALAEAVSEQTRNAFTRFWSRSSAIAELASLIAAERIAVCNISPDQAYLAGIFHQCGVPVLMMRFPDYCKKLRLDDAYAWPDLAEEDANFNVDHSTIGYLVARHWGLPDFVCTAIRYQDEVPSQESGATVALVCILQLAIHAYQSNNMLADPAWDAIGDRVLNELGLGANELNDYLEELLRRYDGTAS